MGGWKGGQAAGRWKRGSHTHATLLNHKAQAAAAV